MLTLLLLISNLLKIFYSFFSCLKNKGLAEQLKWYSTCLESAKLLAQTLVLPKKFLASYGKACQ
jgi:hypothetical protein